MTRNPIWARDELILALALYMRTGRKQLEASDGQIKELSELLNKLPIHDQALRTPNFRSAESVSMKLANFISIDPSSSSHGLPRGGQLDRQVWAEFVDENDRLQQTATSIIKSMSLGAQSERNEVDQQGDEEFLEGKLLTQLHKRKERNRKAVERKKQQVLKDTGKLACEACDFDFARHYGELGYGFAECHHTIPIAQLRPDHHTRLVDLSIVCANCHRMIHRSRPLISIADLSLLIHIERSRYTT